MKTKTFLRPFTLAGAAATVLLVVPTLACASPNDLYVSLQGEASVPGSGSIVRINPTGAPSTFATGLNQPQGLVFDSSGNLYAADAGSGSIFKFSSAGVKSTFATGLNSPYGLAFDSSGNLYAADIGSGSIFKFSPAGGKSTFATGLTRPFGLAFDAQGNLYESEDNTVTSNPGHVNKFSPTGAGIGAVATGLGAYFGLAFDSQGILFASFSSSHAGLYNIYEIGPGGGIFTLTEAEPQGLAFDTEGNLYVAETGKNIVEQFNRFGGEDTFYTGSSPCGFVAVEPQLSFFNGEASLGDGVYYLSFPNGNYFGYYSFLSDGNYIYHFDLGYEYVFDAVDGKSGVYLYDFKSGDFFYTSPTFPFPYLYDFTLNTVLYYYPDPNNAGRYNTDGVRYFYDFATGKTISR